MALSCIALKGHLPFDNHANCSFFITVVFASSRAKFLILAKKYHCITVFVYCDC